MATMAERFIPFPHPLMIGMDDLQRFWSKIDKESSPKGCWLWTGGRSRAPKEMGELGEPYGHFFFCGESYVASRVAWFFEYKEDPGSLLICHGCNVTLCVRPDHLYCGTASMNTSQCVLDGRRNQSGERAPPSKLSDSDAQMILKSNLPGTVLARRLGVVKSTIHAVRQGRTFKHLLVEKG